MAESRPSGPHNSGIPSPDEARELAHELIATTMRECPGWNPPPFTPDLFARVLELSVVRVAENAPWDAMYIPARGRPRIVLNTRHASAGRLNFSLAHEIAHSLIDPEPNEIRFFRASRDYYDGMSSTHALERACDQIAAELLMPAPWLREAISRRGLCAEAVPAIARDFGVSLEATAARMVEIAEVPCAIGFFHFADPEGEAAGRRFDVGTEEDRACWRVRRVFHGRGFPGRFPIGQSVPANSVLQFAGAAGCPAAAVEITKLGPSQKALRVTACPTSLRTSARQVPGERRRIGRTSSVVGVFTIAERGLSTF